jgi:Clp amino terminal domain, pathogenicity island component
MYERFTDRARKVMQLANQEAQRFNHEYIGTEHILLGLIREGSGVAANVLKKLDVDSRKIRQEVEKLVQSDPDMVTLAKPPQTPRAKKVIECSMEEARGLHHDYVGTEHMLLGLLRDDETVAAQVLMNLGLRLNAVRAEILAILKQPSETGDEDSPQSRTRWIKDRPTSVETPPAACPKCGDPNLVRVLWRVVHLSAQDLKDFDAGESILGSCSDVAGPPWICLRCSPAWSEVHALAVQDYKLQLAKEDAVIGQDFDSAVKHRDAQRDLRRQYSKIVEKLLKNQ